MKASVYSFSSQVRRMLNPGGSRYPGKMPHAFIYDVAEREAALKKCYPTESYFKWNLHEAVSPCECTLSANRGLGAMISKGPICFGGVHRSTRSGLGMVSFVAAPNLHYAKNKKLGEKAAPLFKWLLFDSPFKHIFVRPSLSSAQKLGFIMDPSKGSASLCMGAMQIIRMVTEYPSWFESWCDWNKNFPKENQSLIFIASCQFSRRSNNEDRLTYNLVSGSHSFINSNSWTRANLRAFIAQDRVDHTKKMLNEDTNYSPICSPYSFGREKIAHESDSASFPQLPLREFTVNNGWGGTTTIKGIENKKDMEKVLSHIKKELKL